MRRTRFSIGGLMGFVLIAALGFGGLKNANLVWASSCYTLAFASLVALVLAAIQTRGRKRAFSVGYSVVGWLYFVLVFIMPSPSTSMFEAPPFLTSVLIEQAQALFNPDMNNVNPTMAGMIIGPTTATTVMPVPPPAPPPLAVPSTPAPTQLAAAPTPPVVMPPASQVPDEGTEPGPPATPTPVEVTPVAAVPPPGPVAPPVLPTMGLPTTVATTNGAVTSVSYTFPAGTIVPPAPPTFFSNAQSGDLSFQQIGQSMMTLLLAYVGGLFSMFLAARRERSEAAPTPEVSPSSP